MKRDTPISIKSTFRSGKLLIPFLWCAGLAMALLSLVTPRQIGHLTDLFVGRAATTSWREIHLAILMILGAQLLVAALTFFDRALVTQFREKVLRNVERFLFSRVLGFSPEFFRTRTVDSITTRCLDDARCGVEFQCRGLVTLPLAFVSVVIFGTYMMYNNWFLASVMLILSLSGAYFLLFDGPIQRINHSARSSRDDLRDRANEAVSGVEALRDEFSFEYGLRRVEQPINRHSELQTVRGRWMAAFDAFGPLVIMVQLVAVYWVGAALCMPGSYLSSIAGKLTWGQVIQFAMISSLFQKPVGEVFSFLKRWRLVRENMRRVAELLEWEEAFAEGEVLPVSDAARHIQYQDVTVAADDGKPIVNRLSADVSYGLHAAIAGTAGSGKSTLLGLLTSGVKVDAGAVKLGNMPVECLDRRALAEVVGKVPQFPTIFAGTIRDNLLLSLRRPGSKTLQDDGGCISLDTLDGIESSEDLDRRLIEVVKLVDFERDVFRKALDRRLPFGDRYASTKRMIVELRPAVREAVQRRDPEVVCWFQKRICLPLCSLCENLLGPGHQAKQLTDGERGELMLVFNQCKALPSLLQIGYQRFRSEAKLAARLSTNAPRLMKVFDSRNHPAGGEAELQAARPHGLTQLSQAAQLALLQIALDTEAARVADCYSGDASALVLELRDKLQPRFPSQAWSMHDGAGYIESLSVRDNLLGGRVDRGLHRADTRAEDIVLDVLENSGALDDFLLLGLEAQLMPGGQDLSGGQRQKLALGRVLLKDPQVLLLDEATASLDELSENKIVETLRHEFRNKTMISVSRRLATIRGCDKVIVMDRGQKLQEGPFHALAQQDGLFQDLLRGRPPGVRASTAVFGQEHSAAAAAMPAGDAGPLEFLRVCPLFANLDHDRLVAICEVSATVTCRAGDKIFERGDAGNELFVVCEGIVEFFATPKDLRENGDELVDSCGPGEAFGELAVFGQMARTLGARARGQVKLIRLERDDVFQLMDADPSIALSFLQILARRIGGIRGELYLDSASINAKYD